MLFFWHKQIFMHVNTKLKYLVFYQNDLFSCLVNRKQSAQLRKAIKKNQKNSLFMTQKVISACANVQKFLCIFCIFLCFNFFIKYVLVIYEHKTEQFVCFQTKCCLFFVLCPNQNSAKKPNFLLFLKCYSFPVRQIQKKMII